MKLKKPIFNKQKENIINVVVNILFVYTIVTGHKSNLVLSILLTLLILNFLSIYNPEKKNRILWIWKLKKLFFEI